jgi:hypothetical protein
MDIGKAFRYLKNQLLDLDRVIDSIEIAAAAHRERVVGTAQNTGSGETSPSRALVDSKSGNIWIH